MLLSLILIKLQNKDCQDNGNPAISGQRDYFWQVQHRL